MVDDGALHLLIDLMVLKEESKTAASPVSKSAGSILPTPPVEWSGGTPAAAVDELCVPPLEAEDVEREIRASHHHDSHDRQPSRRALDEDDDHMELASDAAKKRHALASVRASTVALHEPLWVKIYVSEMAKTSPNTPPPPPVIENPFAVAGAGGDDTLTDAKLEEHNDAASVHSHNSLQFEFRNDSPSALPYTPPASASKRPIKLGSSFRGRAGSPLQSRGSTRSFHSTGSQSRLTYKRITGDIGLPTPKGSKVPPKSPIGSGQRHRRTNSSRGRKAPAGCVLVCVCVCVCVCSVIAPLRF